VAQDAVQQRWVGRRRAARLQEALVREQRVPQRRRQQRGQLQQLALPARALRRPGPRAWGVPGRVFPARARRARLRQLLVVKGHRGRPCGDEACQAAQRPLPQLQLCAGRLRGARRGNVSGDIAMPSPGGGRPGLRADGQQPRKACGAHSSFGRVRNQRSKSRFL